MIVIPVYHLNTFSLCLNVSLLSTYYYFSTFRYMVFDGNCKRQVAYSTNDAHEAYLEQCQSKHSLTTQIVASTHTRRLTQCPHNTLPCPQSTCRINNRLLRSPPWTPTPVTDQEPTSRQLRPLDGVPRHEDNLATSCFKVPCY